ncbi:hypothetical protein FE257_012708 [Aspergillus nanangensis]|uniref:PQ loop repeat protein n=1 Tax=Aspergillus nanangensis TaxID=2582783 RepID=A0AAD4CH81_ASPNN|nr:hypothetical protein FE257_012708 [Aspergillus nanangensis]
MLILAVYYTLADIVLLAQCFYYRGFTLQDKSSPDFRDPEQEDIEPTTSESATRKPSERSPLIPSQTNGQTYQTSGHDQGPHRFPHAQHRRHSATSFREILSPSVDGTHLSPATPFIEPPSPKASRTARSISTIQTILFNACAVALVCVAGILGWYFSPGSSNNRDEGTPAYSPKSMGFDPLGQFFGYLCAAFYLGSRLPQILLNYRRKSTDGVSLLFFLFACIGNLTYVLSILAYSPVCGGDTLGRCRPGEAGAIYGRYILVNLSWLIGSFGTLFLDMCIFVQFFLYQDNIYVDEENSQDTVRG